MPMYEYACPVCGYQFEELARNPDESVPPCPQCKAKKTARLLSRACLRGAHKDTGASFSSAGKCGGCPGGNCASCG